MNDENELLEPLATEAGQEAIVRAIRDISSLEYAVRAEQAASLASAKAGEASQSAIEASDAEDKAKDWATKTDTYVEQLIITIPPAQEGEEPTTETINLYSAKYYAALALDIYNNMSFDSVPTENSTNMVNSGVVYSALDLKADKINTYTKTEVDTLISTAVSNLVNSAPSTLDTLEELADALGDDPNFATTIATLLGLKADKSDTYTKTEVDTALSNVQSTLTFDNVPTANSDNPVKSSGIKTALDGKQDTLTFDSTPTANSTNPVTSGGVYTALQNVNIDIDDEITEDSDNPVTSAAIYEALQNFTPSGGDDVITTYPNYSRAKSINLSGYITQAGQTYTAEGDGYVTFSVESHTIGWSIYVTVNNVQVWYRWIENSKYIDNPFIAVSKGDVVKVYGNNPTQSEQGTITDAYFIPAKEALLSEQMYSNVLYENSSGTQGDITLSDSYENYDFIEIEAGAYNNWNDFSPSIFKSVNEIKKDTDILVTLYGLSYIRYTISSPTQFTYNSKGGSNLFIFKIVGHKMAKGGYSGIVSDARMTVKSGTYTFTGGLPNSGYNEVAITFDSPMPDANYEVFLTIGSQPSFWTKTAVSHKDKTVNGFTLIAHGDSNTIMTDYIVDWIAIRPNSYTREGMVEDVLFSNANGVNSGTINLSGNISDYDLIEFTTLSSNGRELYPSIVNSMNLISRNSSDSYFVISGYNDNFIQFYCGSDNQLVFCGNQGHKITKITGIKFGRYVSGVAVDTTVTQNSDAVITSGAVYDALQNIPSGGGSGGGSITIDNSITSSSLNPVSSSAIYNVVSPLMPLSLDDISNAQVKLNTSNLAVCVIGGRTYYKRYSDIAAGFVTQVKGNYGQVWIYLILVSPTENGAILYCSYSPSDNAGVSTFVHNGKTYYYSVSIYGWYDKTFSDVSMSLVLVYENTFDTALIAASFLIEYATLKNNFLSTFNITDAYTKTEVDTLLQNAGGSVTVDSSITQNSTNPVESAAIYTALANKGDVTTNTDQNITGTKTFVGSKKVGFKQSTANDKLGFTLYGNTGTERGYLEFNPTNTVDGVTGLMTIGNYATSAAGLTQVGFRRYSNISGASGAYNLLMPMVADARTPFSLTTSYTNFYLPLGFTDGTTTVRTAKSGVVDLSPLLASLEARIAALEGN